MFQENSAPQEDSQSATSSFFHFPRSTDVAGDLGTFSRAIVVEAPGYLEQRAVHSALSFVVHLAAVLAIVWFGPLAFPQRPFVFAMNRQFVTLPLPLPPIVARPNLSFAPRGLANPFLSVKLTAPVMKFAKPMAVPPPEEILRSSPPQITAGFGAALGAILSDASRPAIVPALPLDIPHDARVFRSGGEIKASRLVERVSFDYPEIAKMAHVFGRVVIAAVIDETGKVTQAHLISGPGLLASSAIQALSRERFQPTLLDGQPIKCDLMVDVTFRLAGWTDDDLR
jgi:protein TonB